MRMRNRTVIFMIALLLTIGITALAQDSNDNTDTMNDNMDMMDDNMSGMNDNMDMMNDNMDMMNDNMDMMNDNMTTMLPLPDEIVFDSPGLMPEGIVYDADRDRYLVGSLSEGTIYSVDDNGVLNLFAADELLTTSVGLHIDTVRNYLLVAASDRTSMQGNPDALLPRLFAFDLTNGDLIYSTELPGDDDDSTGHFANDVTVADDGTAYVTDSGAPIIYAVSPTGEASIFLQDDERFSAEQFGLNGIVYSPNGFLIVGNTGTATLYKVPLDMPENISEIAIDMPFGVDGMVLTGDLLTAVARFPDDQGQYVAFVTTDDDWDSGTVVESVETTGAATTIAERDFDYYYINAYLNRPDRASYEIVRVRTPQAVRGYQVFEDLGMMNDNMAMMNDNMDMMNDNMMDDNMSDMNDNMDMMNDNMDMDMNDNMSDMNDNS